MPTLIYRINAGVPNFTAHIEPNVAADQTHTSVGVYSFSDIPAGAYEVTVTDGMGCFVTVNQEFTTTTTSTTALPVTTTTSTTTTPDIGAYEKV